MAFDEGALARLAEHDWPGNVRELRHAVEGAVAATGGTGEVRAEHVRFRLR